MPPRSDRQSTAPSPADRRPIPHQTSGAHADPVEITARPGGLRPHPGEARGAVSEPSQFAPPPRGATLFRPKSPLPEPEWQGDELADAVPFGVGATTEEGAYDEETLAPGEPVASPPEIAKRRPRRLNRSIGGGVLAVALAAGVTYMTLPGKSSVAMPPIAVAVTPPKVVPAYKNGQDMPPNQGVDGAETADKTKLVTPGVGDVASDDNAASGDHSAAGVASASDADADQVSTGKPPPDASPAPAAITPAGPAGVPASASGDATPAPPVAPTGRVFVQFSAQKSETAARSSYHGLRTCRHTRTVRTCRRTRASTAQKLPTRRNW